MSRFLRNAAASATAALAGLMVAGCGGDSATAPGGAASMLRLTVTTSGIDPDPDGYRVIVDGVDRGRAEPNKPVQTFSAPAGTRTLTLEDIATNCTVAGPLPREVTVAAGPTSEPIQVDCTPLVPLGEVIAFARREAGGTFDIYTMNPDGSGLEGLYIEPLGEERHPSIAADGKRVAFSRRVGSGDPVVWTMHANGDEANALYSPAETPAWSPDGQRLAFESGTGASQGVWVLTDVFAFGKPLRTGGEGAVGDIFNVTETGGWAPSWKPGTSTFAFHRQGSIHLIQDNRAGEAQITAADPTVRSDASPVWSPDGSRVAFAARLGQNWEIFVVDADGSGETRLTTNAAMDSAPFWSADGSRILFTSDRDGSLDLFVMAADGSGVVNLTNTPTVDEDDGWWRW